MELKAQRTFMQTSSGFIRRNSGGYALLIILCFLAVCLTIFASTMYWISSNASVTSRNNQFNMSEAAAEAATEKVLSQMNYDYVAQSLSNSGTYYGAMVPTTSTNQQANWLINDQASWPIKYVYSDTNGINNQISVNMGTWTTNTIPLNSQFTGLYGLVQPVTITATATPIGQRYSVPASVTESLQFAAIPLFQFAIFYNMDLEIDPGAAMNIKGAVYSNGGIWSGTPKLTYSSTVSAVGTNYYQPTGTDPFCSAKIDNGGAGSGTPIGNFASTPTSGNDRITMPIGTNNDPATVEALINLPPYPYQLNTANAFSTNGLAYLANAADLYLTNFSSGTNDGLVVPQGTNMILFYQDSVNGPSSYQTQMPYDFYIVTNISPLHHSLLAFTNYVPASQYTNSLGETNRIWYAGYSFITNAIFYDWREGWNGGAGPPKTVQAVQLDVASFNAWLFGTNMPNMFGGTNKNGGQVYNAQCVSHKSHPIDSIYIWNNVLLTGTTLPAVRVVNGAMLPIHTAPKGFTVVSAQPMYVWGNYNSQNSSGSSLGQNSTSYTWPAALMADSITVLSTNWSDANSVFGNKAICTGGGPTPGPTTVNAAMLEGIVRSTNGIYSGGVENFLRLLENWSSVALWYNGSIVVMFPSLYATNYQQVTGKYYSAPNRDWAFDTNFTQQAGLPPITPQSKGVIRASWNAY
jgi:hypothetical protein